MSNMMEAYILRAAIWLSLTTLLYFLMNGAQLFETAVIVPKWTASPPASLQLFQGRHGLDFKVFWIALHSVHEISFFLAIAFCWKLAEVRNALLILLVLHVAVRAWTLLYFAPTIIRFQEFANGVGPMISLLDEAVRWRQLNYLRVGAFIALSIGQLLLCVQVLRLLLK